MQQLNLKKVDNLMPVDKLLVSGNIIMKKEISSALKPMMVTKYFRKAFGKMEKSRKYPH